MEREGNILSHRLEGLEDEGVASRGRFNAVGESCINDVDKEGRRKESDFVIVIIRVGKKARAAGEGIWTCQEFSRNMDHFQVKVSEVNKPAGLSTIEGLGGAEVGEVSYPELYLNPQGIPKSFPSHFRMIPESFPSTPKYSQVFPSFLS